MFAIFDRMNNKLRSFILKDVFVCVLDNDIANNKSFVSTNNKLWEHSFIFHNVITCQLGCLSLPLIESSLPISVFVTREEKGRSNSNLGQIVTNESLDLAADFHLMSFVLNLEWKNFPFFSCYIFPFKLTTNMKVFPGNKSWSLSKQLKSLTLVVGINKL